HTLPVCCVAFSPDGKWLASGAGQDADHPGELLLWDARTGREVLRLPGHGGGVPWLAFSRDGKRLASAGGDRAVRVWELSAGPGGPALKPAGPAWNLASGSLSGVAFSPDGNRLAAAGPRTDGSDVKV